MNRTLISRLRTYCFSTTLILASFFSVNKAYAQTTLAAGDILFTGYNSNNGGTASNLFSFIVMRSGGISSGTVINFTDRGWDQVASALGSATGEGTITWTASTDINQFTEITLKTVTAGSNMEITSTGSAVVTGTFILSSAGDQILSYQGIATSPTFITAIQMNMEVANGASAATDSVFWDHLVATGGNVYNANRSARPPGLGANTSTFGALVNTERDNGRYVCVFDSAATVLGLQTYICRPIHWQFQDVTAYSLPTACAYRLIPPPVITLQPIDAIACTNDTAWFSITASGATSYQWQQNSGSGFTNLSFETSSQFYTYTDESRDNYQFRCVVTGPFNQTTTSAIVTATTKNGLWLGTTNSSWSNAANWVCGLVPTASTNVTIDPAAPNMPIVNVTNATCNNINIPAGASLTITAGNQLNIKGSLTNNGIFTPDGTVLFSGAAQAIPAASYANLQIAGSGTKTIAGDITVSGTLTLTNGYVQLDNHNLTIGDAGNISGGSTASFVVTNSTGALRQNNIGTAGRTTFVFFPIGASSSSFTLVGLVNSGTPDQFSARVATGVNNGYDINDASTGAAITNFNVNKTWFVSEAVAGGSNVTLTFQWYNTDEQPGFDRLNSFAGHYTGGHWTRGPENQAASGSNPYSLSLSSITSFSPFGVGSAGSLLPVHLISFTGDRVNGGVLLEWNTENEKNLADYGIEKSADGQHYENIGKINATNEPGSHQYSFSDANATASIIYYRLKQTDMDGRYTYSPVIALSGNNERQVALVYPNPTSNQATLQVNLPEAVKMNFSIISNAGAILKKWQGDLRQGNSYETINLSGYAAGIYYLELKTQNYQRKIKIVKQ